MKGRNMQKTINKYQSRFDGLMKSIEKDKILKKMPGNATAGIAVQMIKDLKNNFDGVRGNDGRENRAQPHWPLKSPADPCRCTRGGGIVSRQPKSWPGVVGFSVAP